MANASIGGLVSGLDTATIISQLVQLEARPQTMLKSRVSTAERAVTALQTLNAKLAAIGTQAKELATSTGWITNKATSSSDKVSVSSTAGATPGTLSFTVNSVATAAAQTFTTTGAPGDLVMDANLSYRIEYADGRAAEEITTGSGSLRDVAEALNAKTGVRATMVMVGSGTTPTYELRVESTATGGSSGFTITQFEPANPTTPLATPTPFMGGASAAKSVSGADASLIIAGQATPLAFSSNTITGLMPGLDITLSADSVNETPTITVARDVTSLTDSVKSMIDSVNAAIGEIGTLTAYDATTKKAGLLGGDSTLRTVRNQLLEAVTYGVDGKSLATIGIESDRYGKLTFDEAKFRTAYVADPAGTAHLVAGTDAPDGTQLTAGLADKLQSLSKTFSDSIDGTVTNAIKSRQSAIRGWQDDIADWDVRLDARRNALQRQYTALESALGKLQSQGTWLAGQIASLPTMSSGQ